MGVDTRVTGENHHLATRNFLTCQDGNFIIKCKSKKPTFDIFLFLVGELRKSWLAEALLPALSSYEFLHAFWVIPITVYGVCKPAQMELQGPLCCGDVLGIAGILGNFPGCIQSYGYSTLKGIKENMQLMMATFLSLRRINPTRDTEEIKESDACTFLARQT